MSTMVDQSKLLEKGSVSIGESDSRDIGLSSQLTHLFARRN